MSSDGYRLGEQDRVKGNEVAGPQALLDEDVLWSRNTAPLTRRSRRRSRTRYSNTRAGPHAATDRHNWHRRTKRSPGVPPHSSGLLLGTIAPVFAPVETWRILFWATPGVVSARANEP